MAQRGRICLAISEVLFKKDMAMALSLVITYHFTHEARV